MVARREKMWSTSLNLPARHSLTSLEQIVFEVGTVMPLTAVSTPEVTPLPLFPIIESKIPEDSAGPNDKTTSNKSVEKKKFTVIEPAVFLVYVATALAGKTFVSSVHYNC